MKNQLNRELIVGLNESNNQEFLEKINDYIYNLFSNVVYEISLKSPFIRAEKSNLSPVNELYTGAIAQLSEYTYFLGVENSQIELNSKNKKNFWKNLWREFRAAWRLGKKKYKKSKKGPSIETIDKYKLSDLRHDVVNKLSEYLSESSIIYEYNNYISIVGKEDLGSNVKVNVYICCYESNKKIYKLFNQRKNRFVEIDFGNRFANLHEKNESVGEMFTSMIRIFNALYSKAYNRIPHQILIESLIFNCPKILFDKKDVYKSFLNVANFIRLANPQTITSICDGSKNIFEENLIFKVGAQMEYSKIISMLDKFTF